MVDVFEKPEKIKEDDSEDEFEDEIDRLELDP